jgi:hypothetical protein
LCYARKAGVNLWAVTLAHMASAAERTLSSQRARVIVAIILIAATFFLFVIVTAARLAEAFGASAAHNEQVAFSFERRSP